MTQAAIKNKDPRMVLMGLDIEVDHNAGETDRVPCCLVRGCTGAPDEEPAQGRIALRTLGAPLSAGHTLVAIGRCKLRVAVQALSRQTVLNPVLWQVSSSR